MAASGIDKALGISPQVLALRTQRMNLLTANIANADTPNYKARDIDFRSALEQAKTSLAQLNMTNTRHMPLAGSAEQPTVMFRQPLQESTNGNTVDAQSEHAAFMENAMRYQASLQLLDNRIKGIKNAIKGEA
ncbi:flagellar basal body rod protein FlgB [Luminiphilus sp.]|jgi:flagellar basal-body rod protein FlgB|nr:flagellar basal body rod protein FlgB [Luminiphilus sp.]MDA8814910.1 flagellar basal body rod protein FlgB [Luminiphilus sp.]MDB2379399.1 flagellar basal body rod protein FlgB [Luminiphilus sp.]MDB3899205.1 flagellar basal body rod protein FlgB [Luminiphilus sp.]